MADGRGSGALRQTIGNTLLLFMPVVKVLSEPSINRPSPVRRADVCDDTAPVQHPYSTRTAPVQHPYTHSQVP